MSPIRRRALNRFVSTALFHSPEFLSLPEDGQSRFLFVFLLLNPLGGTFHTPGIYQVGPEALREAARMPRRAFQAAFENLLSKRVIEVDPHWRLIWLPVALELMAPPANPNVVKGICRSIGSLPSCGLLDKAKGAYRELLETLGEQFVEPFRDLFENPSESLPHPLVELNNDLNLIPIPTDHHPGQSNRDLSSDPTSPVGVADLMAYASALGWRCSSRKALTRSLYQLEGLTWAEVLSGKGAVEARQGVSDHVAYLLGVIRTMRAEKQHLGAAGKESTNNFGGLRDGQKIAWES